MLRPKGKLAWHRTRLALRILVSMLIVTGLAMAWSQWSYHAAELWMAAVVCVSLFLLSAALLFSSTLHSRYTHVLHCQLH